MRNLPSTRHDTQHTRHTPLSLTRRRIALKSFLSVGLLNERLRCVRLLKASLRIKRRFSLSVVGFLPVLSVLLAGCDEMPPFFTLLFVL